MVIDHVEKLRFLKPVDWRPESNNIVNDLIHPSMYCFRQEPKESFDYWEDHTNNHTISGYHQIYMLIAMEK